MWYVLNPINLTNNRLKMSQSEHRYNLSIQSMTIDHYKSDPIAMVYVLMLNVVMWSTPNQLANLVSMQLNSLRVKKKKSTEKFDFFFKFYVTEKGTDESCKYTRNGTKILLSNICPVICFVGPFFYGHCKLVDVLLSGYLYR